MNNEKSLYTSQNYVIKAISILSDMANSILKTSDADTGGSLDHVSLVKSCLNTITLLSHILADFTRKRKHNLKNIVHSDSLALCGPKPGTTAAKIEPKNQRSTFLLGENLKQEAKDAHCLQELAKKVYKEDFKENRQTQARDQTKSARKVVKITINHHNSGDQLFTTTITALTTTATITIPTGSHIIP